jgi:hypothetical protein
MSTTASTTFELMTSDDPIAVVRVLSTLQQRRCRITGIDFQEVDRSPSSRWRVTLEPPLRHAHCVEAWLRNLVVVLEVHELPARRVAPAREAETV